MEPRVKSYCVAVNRNRRLLVKVPLARLKHTWCAVKSDEVATLHSTH